MMVYETMYVTQMTIPQWWMLHKLYNDPTTCSLTTRAVRKEWGLYPAKAKQVIDQLEAWIMIDIDRGTEKTIMPCHDGHTRHLVKSLLAELKVRMYGSLGAKEPLDAPTVVTQPVNPEYRIKTMQELWVLHHLYHTDTEYLTTTDMSSTWFLSLRRSARIFRGLVAAGMVSVMTVNRRNYYGRHPGATLEARALVDDVYARFAICDDLSRIVGEESDV